jgi:hypothetical protein
MAQHCIWSGGKHRCHPAALTTLWPMPDGVDAPLNPAKASTGDAVLDRPSAHPKLQELLPADNPVLDLGELPNPVVDRTERGFSMHDMGNRRLVWHGANRSRSRRAGGAPIITKGARKRGSSPPVPPLALIP